MSPRLLERTVVVARLSTALSVAGGIAACAGVVVGGELPLTAIGFCFLLWPMAVVSLIVWATASAKLKRHTPAVGQRGFEVMTEEPPQ